MAEAEVIGYQGKVAGDPNKIISCAKHYLGDGGTKGGKDQGDTVCDEATLGKIFLPGYIKAIEAGVDTVMVSFSSWNGAKMHGNKYLITDVLKTELGFGGFVVSDWNAINQLAGSYQKQIATSINAGLDMIMVPDKYTELFLLSGRRSTRRRYPWKGSTMRSAGSSPVKFRFGIFENPMADRSLLKDVGSKEHRQVARECVRQSVVLLKNEKDLLPLSKTLKRIFVAGKNADNIGAMCGGWTISWQGDEGNITDGTTILAAIRNTVSTGTKVTYSRDGTDSKGADVGIAVIGELPYAEV